MLVLVAVHDPQLTSMLKAMHQLGTLQNKLQIFGKLVYSNYKVNVG